jgi:chorismate dehydratase
MLHCHLFRNRVCAVSYLNTLPLVWGMLHGRQRNAYELTFAIPSVCADRIESGAADIGIVPSAEVPRLALEIIPGTGIASCGPVRTILLISKVHPSAIRTVAADASSRTSVQLARIILAKRYGSSPDIALTPPNLDSMLQSADAALIIGDPALRIEPARLPYFVLDLGAEWVELTGLPMVFAVWAGPPGVATIENQQAFADSCRFGLEHLDDIAAAAESERGIRRDIARRYLAENLVLELGPREYTGLDLFLRSTAELAEAPFATLVNSDSVHGH